MSLIRDVTLRRLARERLSLLRKLAPVLKRTGPFHKHRAQENRRRALLRKELRSKLKANERNIVTHIMLLFQHLTPED